MLNPKLHLADPFSADTPKAATRDGFGSGVVEAGELDPRVIVLCADLAESTRTEAFKKRFPDRFVEVGVAEQNLAALAAGFAGAGKIPFIASYAAFSPGRNNEQIRTTISLNDVPVKVMGMHAGISVGPDGATHQALEDMALMRAQPNMTVINPCDAQEAHRAALAVSKTAHPAYIRFGRSDTPAMTTADTPFAIGKGYALWHPPVGHEPQVAIIGCGALLYRALLAARELEREGIGVAVINMHTVKPLDEHLLLELAPSVRGIVTVEEHQVAGGLGSAIAEFLAEHHPLPMRMIGVRDRFGQSGTPDELIEHYGLGERAIAAAARSLLAGSK
jgi:transketolase